MQQFMLEPAAVDTHNFIEYKASPNKTLFDKIQWEIKLFKKKYTSKWTEKSLSLMPGSDSVTIMWNVGF